MTELHILQITGLYSITKDNEKIGPSCPTLRIYNVYFPSYALTCIVRPIRTIYNQQSIYM
jgi:hypothetical protein